MVISHHLLINHMHMSLQVIAVLLGSREKHTSKLIENEKKAIEGDIS